MTLRDLKIYIPIWLDLLCFYHIPRLMGHKYLHSNMVRFIIKNADKKDNTVTEFTFQYG